MFKKGAMDEKERHRLKIKIRIKAKKNPQPTNSKAGSDLGKGITSPRLERKTFGKGLKAFLTIGNISVINVYQKKSCNKSGIFLRLSIQQSEILDTNQLRESLAIPIRVPKVTAKKFPIMATLTVLKKPAESAFP